MISYLVLHKVFEHSSVSGATSTELLSHQRSHLQHQPNVLCYSLYYPNDRNQSVHLYKTVHVQDPVRNWQNIGLATGTFAQKCDLLELAHLIERIHLYDDILVSTFFCCCTVLWPLQYCSLVWLIPVDALSHDYVDLYVCQFVSLKNACLRPFCDWPGQLWQFLFLISTPLK